MQSPGCVNDRQEARNEERVFLTAASRRSQDTIHLIDHESKRVSAFLRAGGADKAAALTSPAIHETVITVELAVRILLICDEHTERRWQAGADASVAWGTVGSGKTVAGIGAVGLALQFAGVRPRNRIRDCGRGDITIDGVISIAGIAGPARTARQARHQDSHPGRKSVLAPGNRLPVQHRHGESNLRVSARDCNRRFFSHVTRDHHIVGNGGVVEGVAEVEIGATPGEIRTIPQMLNVFDMVSDEAVVRLYVPTGRTQG